MARLNAVLDRLRDKVQRVQHQQQHDQSSPVVLRANAPPRSIPAQQPLRHALPGKEPDQQQHGGEHQPLRDVVERIVAQLMAEDAGDLIGSGLRDGRVPDHQPLRRPEAGDIGVQPVTFWLAFMKNIRSGGMLTPPRATTFSSCSTSAGLRLLQRLELVEERIDQNRREKDPEQDCRHRRNPEPEPPALRRLADHPEQQHHQQPADEPRQQKAFRLVPEPASPALHRQPVGQGDMMPIDLEGSVKQSDCQQKEKREDKTLPPPALG